MQGGFKIFSCREHYFHWYSPFYLFGFFLCCFDEQMLSCIHPYDVNKTAVMVGRQSHFYEGILKKHGLGKENLKKIVQGLCKYVFVLKHSREGNP